MQLQLNQYFIRNFHFEQITLPEEMDTNNFTFNFNASFYSQRLTEFFIEFYVDIKNPKEFNCNFLYVFFRIY